MREIEVSMLTDVIEKLCIEANEHLPSDVKEAIKRCRACETERSPRVCWTILLRILTSQIRKTCRSVRIPEWHVSFWKLARMCISSAET